MVSLFKNKYRSESDRLRGYNYNLAGAYYLTIVTKNRIQYFGSIESGGIVLNKLGYIVQEQWLNTPHIRPDMNIYLDEFVIMPDHFHAILIIGKNQFNTQDINSNNCSFGNNYNHDTSIKPISSVLFRNNYKFLNCFGPQSKNLASIIRGFKSATTTYARKNNLEFAWQNRFYDHIIRSDFELRLIRNYIINNPSKWIDNFNPGKCDK